jgi:hypothetical protein
MISTSLQVCKMPWSIDTTLSLISLFITGVGSVLQVWNFIRQNFRRTSSSGQLAGSLRKQSLTRLPDHNTEASIATGLNPTNLDLEILLESGLRSQELRVHLVSRLTSVSLASCKLTSPRALSRNQAAEPDQPHSELVYISTRDSVPPICILFKPVLRQATESYLWCPKSGVSALSCCGDHPRIFK